MKAIFRSIITYSVNGVKGKLIVSGQKSFAKAIELIKRENPKAILEDVYHDEL